MQLEYLETIPHYVIMNVVRKQSPVFIRALHVARTNATLKPQPPLDQNLSKPSTT